MRLPVALTRRPRLFPTACTCCLTKTAKLLYVLL